MSADAKKKGRERGWTLTYDNHKGTLINWTKVVTFEHVPDDAELQRYLKDDAPGHFNDYRRVGPMQVQLYSTYDTTD